MFKRIKDIFFLFQIKFNPIKIFFDRVEEHHLYLIAAGIAFNILLYLMPLLLVAVYIVNLIVGVDVISGELISSLEGILPPNSATTDFIQTTLKEVDLIFGKSKRFRTSFARHHSGPMQSHGFVHGLGARKIYFG